jgi:hypothetical protein
MEKLGVVLVSVNNDHAQAEFDAVVEWHVLSILLSTTCVISVSKSGGDGSRLESLVS